MPFINGKFYMNPAYGSTLERARLADQGKVWSEEYLVAVPWTDRARPAQALSEQHEPHQQEPGTHWVTINHRHVLIHDNSTVRKLADHLKATKVNKIYNEFSGLRPKPGVTTDEDLNRARRNAAHVYQNRHGGGFQGSSTLGPDDARDIKIPGTDAAKGYQATKDALDQAEREPDTT